MTGVLDGPTDEVLGDIAAGLINQWSELYALDALSEAERRTIDKCLSAASDGVRLDFEDRVRQARETITAVYAGYEAKPPVALRPRILEQMRVDTSGLTTTSAPVAGPAATGGDELSRRRRRKGNQGPGARRWIIGAAAAAGVVVGSVTLAQSLEAPSLREQVLQAADRDSATAEIAGGGTVRIELSSSLNAAVVTLNNVPVPEAGKVYQMWGLPEDGSAPEPMGTMTSEASAGTTATVRRGIDPYSTLAITVEPEGGSTTPTMPIMAQAPLET